ncbi:unnamed protein product [Meganyctiphanes norvegica]|uniref:Uncharacterized protein n=1 Tax=Meganyctiphanes norvegica TaxID=48144 RepID=A0AAV2Q4L2_MEGNR
MQIPLVLPHAICSNLTSLNSIIFLSAHLYIKFRSLCMAFLSSSVFIFRLFLVSSAKHLMILLLTSSSMSDIIITKSMAASTVPCGTPDLTSCSSDISPFATTLYFLSLRNSLIHMPTFPFILCFTNFCNRMLWFTLSNALAKSRYTVSILTPSAIASYISQKCSSSWVCVLFPGTNPCCPGFIKPFSNKCFIILVFTTLSKTFII